VVEIVTERLSLRPFRADDLETFVTYRSDPEVARYQSWDRTYSMADAESFLRSQRAVEFGQPGEWLQLAIVDRETGTVCGDCAVLVVTDQPATAEVGVTLAPANQGKGLATEALTAVVTELFEQRGMVESLLRPTIATFRFGLYWHAWAFAARPAWSRRTGSKASGQRCGFTRCSTGSGARARTRSGSKRIHLW
jgi:GNAT superfamily N-acetyltransferase